MFTTTAVKATKPPTYTREDTQGEPIQGKPFMKRFRRVCKKSTRRASAQKGEKDRVLVKFEKLQQCVQFVDTTGRP